VGMAEQKDWARTAPNHIQNPLCDIFVAKGGLCASLIIER